MTLQLIELDNLTLTTLNVRKHGAKEVNDLIASIRSIGLLQPLVVREAQDGDTFEVIAGQRRYLALIALAEEADSTPDPVPCVILQAGDDAAAVEASLAENIARLPMDEVDQYKAFAKLIREGRSVEEIAASFGLTDGAVRQRLALGNLHSPILTAYRKGELNIPTIRNLTLATPKQQKEWWALYKDEDAYAPMGQSLKDWLFGGAHIPVCNALFDVEASGLAVVSDLFGEDSYFVDSVAFWAKQNEAIAETLAAYQAKGWTEVIVMDIGAYFATWDHRKTAKTKGGKVFISCSTQGEVTIHEGYITKAEAKRLKKAERGEAAKPERPELTKAMQNYLSLHRHAAVRADLLNHPQTALRLIAAHMIAGSSLWSVDADPQRADKPEIAESLETNTGQQRMDEERRAIAEMAGLEEHTEDIIDDLGAWASDYSIAGVLSRLELLSDDDVIRLLTCVMAESLEAGSDAVEAVAHSLGTDISAAWSIDEVFFDLLRDKEAINGMVGEIAGDLAAKQHLTSTAKVQKAVIRACLDGTRTPVIADWTPRYMALPMQGYTKRSGIETPALPVGEPEAIAAE